MYSGHQKMLSYNASSTMKQGIFIVICDFLNNWCYQNRKNLLNYMHVQCNHPMLPLYIKNSTWSPFISLRACDFSSSANLPSSPPISDINSSKSLISCEQDKVVNQSVLSSKQNCILLHALHMQSHWPNGSIDTCYNLRQETRCFTKYNQIAFGTLNVLCGNRK